MLFLQMALQHAFRVLALVVTFLVAMLSEAVKYAMPHRAKGPRTHCKRRFIMYMMVMASSLRRS